MPNWDYKSAPFTAQDLEDQGLPDGYIPAWFGPANVSTVQARWDSNEGVFLFLKLKETDETTIKPAFLNRLEEFLQDPLYHQVRFLWIENPADPLILWRTHSISVQSDGDKKVLRQRAYLNIRNYAFSIPQGAEVELIGDAFSLHPGTQPFMWSAGYGEHDFFDISAVSIPMTGDDAGCLKFAFSIRNETWTVDVEGADGKIEQKPFFGYRRLAQLDIGFRMFFHDPEFPVSGNDFFLASHRYPFLQESYDVTKAKPFFLDNINWEVSLDLLYPLSQQRSYFEFDPAGITQGLPSAFRTNRGYTVHLQPKAGQSRLVFATRPATLREEDLNSAPFYLVPSGKFELKIPKYKPDEPLPFVGEANIICGISGLEYIRIGSGFTIQFIPQKPAYTGSFLSIYALLRDFNSIQKRYQRSVWADPADPGSMPLGGTPKDLPESYDLDWEIEDTDGLNISDDARLAMLEEVLAVYFPDNFFVSKSQRELYLSIAIVEDWLQWFRDLMKEATMLIARGGDLLNDAVTTSWAYITGSPNAIYYAQPDNAVLHMAEATSTEFLDYMEVPAMGLPESINNPARLKTLSGSETPAFPMLPYGNIDPGSVTDLRQIEMLVLNPVRRKMIQHIGEADQKTGGTTGFSTELTTDNTGNRIGTTPQGLIAKFSEDWKTINELQLAKDTKNKQISFVDIPHGSPLKSALQSNQLFLVVSDPAAIADYFSNATLRENLRQTLNDHIQDASLETNLETTLKNDLKGVFDGDLEGAPFKRALKDVVQGAAIGNPLKNTLNEAIENALENDLDILDWVFELGPEFWTLHDTILVFKYTDTALQELAAKPEQWFMPGFFNESAQVTSANLQQLLSEAIELGTGTDQKAKRKYEGLAVAASQPNWTGIIVLNAYVPLRGLPDSLKALAGGMNPDLFYAKFVGVEVTQVKTSIVGSATLLNPQQSSIFGLIDYDNPEVPVAEPTGYNFHVPSLSIVFKNSHIVHFAAQVDLILEKIFDERARLLNSPNNIVSLRGVAEEQNGRVTYAFGFSGANRFRLSGKVLEEVEIIKAQFATDPLPPIDQRPDILPITGRFYLWGGIRFAYLRDFDILSFGRTPNTLPADTATPAAEAAPPDYLNFSNLEITLDFDMDQRANKVLNRAFGFDPSKISIDMIKSGWRAQSVFEQFPLAFRGFINVRTASGAEVKTGYMPVSVPARRAELEANYYAMKFDLKLGNLGALSGSKPLVAGILVAWNPGKEGIFVGLKLPGSSGDKKEIIIQGLLRLTFGSIRFVVFDKEEIPAGETEADRKTREKEERGVGYLLNLKNIKLNFFMLSFPPIGRTEMTLFGDPRDGIERADRLIGWYAAYVKN